MPGNKSRSGSRSQRPGQQNPMQPPRAGTPANPMEEQEEEESGSRREEEEEATSIRQDRGAQGNPGSGDLDRNR